MTNFTYYTINRGGLIELRQVRFADKYAQGVDHPHDVCAIARSNDEMRQMVESCKLSAVDYSRTATTQPQQAGGRRQCE